MFRHCALAGLAVGIFALAPAVLPQDADTAAPEDKQVVSSKVIHGSAAASVNFRKQLKLSFPSLQTLGPRIDAARRSSDPVALAHAASELSVAEKVSGKRASLTSTALINEAAELAKLRRQAAELQAAQRVATQIAGEQEVVMDLKKEIASAQAQAAMEAQAGQQNLEPTWVPRTVVVNNYTTQYLTIFVNGNYNTEIGPGLAQTLTIAHRWNPMVLTAHGDQDIDSWGPRYLWGRFKTYTWNIN